MRYPLVRWTGSNKGVAHQAAIAVQVRTPILRLIALPLFCFPVCSGDMKSVIETYNLMSLKWFTHATPTLFNAGTQCPQLSSWSVEHSVGWGAGAPRTPPVPCRAWIVP